MMGAEAKARRHVDGSWVDGRALLETDEFVFRGDARCKIPFRDIKSVDGTGKRLEVKTGSESFVFEIEADAAAWAKKIQNPKGRLEKLGVKPGLPVALLCMSDDTFRDELEAAKVSLTTHDKDLALLFVGVGDRSELAGFRSWARKIAPNGAVWLVYPKGRKEVTENDVLDAGRKAGLTDVKVVRFSETHTALKFVVPTSAR